jgi:signal transduction histidine kinase
MHPDAVITSRIFLILLTYLLQVLPSQFYKLSSELKQEALQNRLNLIGYLSHEMRTPLNTAYLGLDFVNMELRGVKERLRRLSSPSPPPSLSGWQGLEAVDWLLSAPQLDDIITTTCHVLDACQIASQTLNDLLTIDKIGDGKLQVALNPCNPWALIKRCLGPFSINAKEKEIQFSCECIDRTLSPAFNWKDELFVLADEFKINQVLRNMLSNALKFTPRQGSVATVVEILSHDPKTSKIVSPSNLTFDRVLRVSVRDSGPGISPEDQKKLFGKYVQFNPGMLQKGGGSGLGLWISKSEITLALTTLTLTLTILTDPQT